ncbi:DUF2231 domain-containing protein [Gordonia aichiensis]|uniref:DUF2231 domain-containing protein n=1 Tax=Gordonia aichiensis TaxID=36820 RepID=UPI003263EFB4
MPALRDEDRHPAVDPPSAYSRRALPILVRLPIIAWVLSIAFDLLARVGDPEVFTRGARWLIGIGVLGAVAAAVVGFRELLAIPERSPTFRTAAWHMSLMLLVTIGFGVDFWWRIPASAPVATGWGPLALSAVCLTVMIVAGGMGTRVRRGRRGRRPG